MWSQKALEYGGRFLRRAVADADDLEARGAMMLAASMAGVGFGSAGVHIPHACAYPIAGLKHRASATSSHGISVIVTAPAAFAWTYEADPERHDRAAELLGGTSLPEALMALMKDLGVPTGLGANSATPRTTSRRSSRARWPSSACSSARRASPARTTSRRSCGLRYAEAPR